MNTHQRGLFLLAAILCISPYIQPPVALLIGIICAQILRHPFPEMNSKIISWLLKISIVGLGFGINLYQAIQAGKEGFLFTICSIGLTIFLGWLLSHWTNMESKTSYLISCGTAICGGSAIAAISPIINANEKQMSVALGTVFILNALALLAFPAIGHYLNMSQHQFGLWCAIAIHDTSSVVGAATAYGDEALTIATTIKLARALWIIPLVLITAVVYGKKAGMASFPLFILFFVMASLANTYLHIPQEISKGIVSLSKSGLSITLLLIGANISVKNIRETGVKALLFGFLLWLILLVGTLLVIINF